MILQMRGSDINLDNMNKINANKLELMISFDNIVIKKLELKISEIRVRSNFI